MAKQYVYRVAAYYNLNMPTDVEILQELYTDKTLAQQRCKQLIAKWKENGYTKLDSDEWNERKYSILAFLDDQWYVDISFKKQEALTSLPQSIEYDY